MTTTPYARLDGSTVVELFSTAADITTLFNPTLRWVAVTDPAVKVGWVQTPTGLAAPAASSAGSAAALATPAPTLAMLQAQLNAISAQLAALQAATPHA